MESVLDDLAFLANSTNRVETLELLAGGPRTRRDLDAETAGSRVTLGRVLTELETRNWVERRGDEYRLTPLGEWVYEAFTDLLETMETAEQLREIVRWFPTDSVSFDVAELADAEILTPSATDLTVPVRRVAERYQFADRAKVVTDQVAPPIIDAVWRAVVYDDQHFEGVLTPDLFDAMMNDAEMSSRFLGLVESPNADVYGYDGELSVRLFIVDELVGIALSDADDTPRAMVLSESEAVRNWATDTFETYREKARPVTLETFTV